MQPNLNLSVYYLKDNVMDYLWLVTMTRAFIHGEGVLQNLLEILKTILAVMPKSFLCKNPSAAIEIF